MMWDEFISVDNKFSLHAELQIWTSPICMWVSIFKHPPYSTANLRPPTPPPRAISDRVIITPLPSKKIWSYVTMETAVQSGLGIFGPGQELHHSSVFFHWDIKIAWSTLHLNCHIATQYRLYLGPHSYLSSILRMFYTHWVTWTKKSN